MKGFLAAQNLEPLEAFREEASEVQATLPSNLDKQSR